MLGSNLICIALADISAKAHVESCVLQQVVDEGSGGGFSVGAGDADLLCRVVAACKFNLGDNGDAVFLHLLHHGNCSRDARGLHHFIGTEDKLLRVLSLLEGDVPLLEGFYIGILDLSLVREEHIESFHFCQNRSAYSAFRAA